MKNWKEKSIIKGILQTFVKKYLSGRFTKYGGPEEYGGHMIKYEELWRLTHQDRIDKKLKKIKWRWIVHTPRKIYWGLSIGALRDSGEEAGPRKTCWERTLDQEVRQMEKTWGK